MAGEPALDFWLRYVEKEGGLVEPAHDVALAVMPPRLADTFGCSEDVLVTADPQAAREEGAHLLIPGHPALDRAAADVLDRGDSGHAWLSWPASRPPSEALQKRARERFPIAQGRLDVSRPLASVYAPVVQIGALATYGVSLDERFQERLEVWVDGRTGQELDGRVRAVLRTTPRLPAPEVPHPRLGDGLEQAVVGAHGAAERQARVRLAQLAGAVEDERRAEQARAEEYFAAALDALARRQAGADAERRDLLEAQADATRAERSRRLREIDEAFRPHHEVRPYRLHVIWAPALRVPVHVRCGRAAHPLTLTWLLAPVATFAPVACPTCGAASPLVAARERLGCRSCLPHKRTP